MATILLRMARLDSLDGNAEPQPPNGESAQVEETIGRGEGHAVVGTNGSWQATFLKQSLKGGWNVGKIMGTPCISELGNSPKCRSVLAHKAPQSRSSWKAKWWGVQLPNDRVI